MALDALEKERLRKKMAMRMSVFLENSKVVSCISSHYYEEPRDCELCQMTHAEEILVVKNRANKKLHLASSCLKEMVRFHVVDEVEDLGRWLDKLVELKSDNEKRKAELAIQRDEERKKLEKKVIIRRRTPLLA